MQYMVVWASRVVTNNEGKLYLLESSDDVSQKTKDVTRRVVTPKKIIIRNNTQGLEFIKPTGEFFKNTEIVEE